MINQFHLLLFILVSQLFFCQKVKENSTTAVKYEARQPQDFSVPPPPNTTFPAQFPKGNREFLSKVKKELNQKSIGLISGKLIATINVKVDSDGNVINISIYGKNEAFNKELKVAADKATDSVVWLPGKNNKGEKIVDIVRLPFKY